MVNYYFFKSKYQLNAQGEYRVILRAVPSQSTYDIGTRTIVPVRTDMRVQADSESLGRIVRSTVGTIWGIRLEGRTPHAASLKIYSRMGSEFYRAEHCVREDNFDEAMAAAWRIVNGTVEPEIQMPVTTEDTAQAEKYIHERLSAGSDFVATVKAHAGENCLGGREVIALSRLYDRLCAGIVKFKYTKNSDGSERSAIGTRNAEVIRQYGQAEAAAAPESRQPFDGTHVTYFDLQRRAWRSFTADNFLTNPEFYNNEEGTFIHAQDFVRDSSLVERLAA